MARNRRQNIRADGLRFAIMAKETAERIRQEMLLRMGQNIPTVQDDTGNGRRAAEPMAPSAK